MPPIQERVDSCKLFLERVKKRVQRAREVIDRVCEQRALYEAEVVEGEARLAKLVAEAANIQALPVVPPQVSELQARVGVLVSERDALRSAASVQIPGKAQGTWTASGPHRFADIPPIPTSDVPGSLSLVEPTQLRVAQCNRVRGPSAWQRLVVWLGKAHRCSPQ